MQVLVRGRFRGANACADVSEQLERLLSREHLPFILTLNFGGLTLGFQGSGMEPPSRELAASSVGRLLLQSTLIGDRQHY